MNYNFSNEIKKETSKKINKEFDNKPTPAFIGASWVALIAGMLAFCTGLSKATMMLNEKGYYLTILLFGLFSAVSVQKNVRDRLEGTQVTDMYYGISWFAALASITLLIVGLWNADLEISEKGFYGMSFLLSLFAAIAVQKNTRDKKFIEGNEEE
jgi:uncharacterized membrane protein YiaA